MANTVSLGTLSSTDVTQSAAWAGSFARSDVYNFTISSGSTVSGVLSNDYRISNFVATLSGPTSSQTFSVASSPSFTVAAGASSPFDFGALVAGDYSLTLTGNPSRLHQPGTTTSGAYTLTLRALATPAPVPGPAGALVAAAGGLLILARMRKAKKQAIA